MNDIEIREIPIKDIIFDEFQPRQIIRQAELVDLAKDIKERGLLYPILVLLNKDQKYYILDGERRVRACLLNDLQSIQARILDVNYLQAYEIQFVSNFKRATVEIQETAKAVERFKQEYLETNPDGDYVKRLTELTGYSRTYFDSAEAINRSPQNFKEKVFEKKIGGYTATEIEKVNPDKSIQAGLQEGYVIATEKGKKISALAPRPLKRQLREIGKREEYSNDDRRSLARDLLLDSYGLSNGNGKIEGNYLLYLETVRQWEEEVSRWSVFGLTTQQQKILAGNLANLLVTFNEKRRVTFGEPTKGSSFKTTTS